MTTVRDLIQRDIGVRVEGVVKVFDRAALATEMREYVVTDKIENELKRIFDTFTHLSETLRRGGPARDVMGIWISGFFGSGKSHFAKVLGHLFQNTSLDDGVTERCIDAFVKHLSDTPHGRDIRLRLAELKLTLDIQAVPPDKVAVSWPASAVGCTLASAPSPAASADWRSEPNAPVRVGDQLVVTTLATDAARFYRLQ